jgi:outer membrane receptor for ferrienterochelin and colicins
MPKLTRLYRTLVLAGLATLPKLALASSSIEADIDKLMPLSLLELINVPVVTASRQSETRDQTPSHIMVVTREQIRERRYKNLADLLEDMPGVDFQRGTKSSQYNQFSIQGYVGPNKLLIMQDGIRIGHPAGGNIPVAENLALYHAKQVEFLYGPAAALYGADAVAGVINIITEHAGNQQGSWGSISTGNFGSRETSFMTGFKHDDQLAFNVGGHWQYSDRAPLQNFYPREFTKVDAKYGALANGIPQTITAITAANRENYVGDISSHSLYARLDLADKLTVGFFRNRFQSLTSTGDAPAMAIYSVNSAWTTTTDTVYGKYRFEVTPQLSGELVVDHSRLEVAPQSNYNNTYNLYQPGYSYVLGERMSIEQSFNWRINEVHRAQFGAGYQRYYAIETASLPAPYNTSKSVSNQGLTYSGTLLPLSIYDVSFDNLSTYLQLQSEWNQEFSTMAGLRLDRHSDFGTTVTPRVGGVWKLNESHILKVLYGEAFRAPSPEEMLSSYGTLIVDSGNGNITNSGFRIPNFSLQPEKAKTLSLTWDWRPRQDVNFVTNLYQSYIENLIINRTITGTDITTIPGATLTSPETKDNAGWQKQHGLDLIAQWRFQVNSAWNGDLWSSASWISGQIDEGNGVAWNIPLVTNQKLKLGTTLRYHDQFTISPQILWIGDTTSSRKKKSGVLTWQCDQHPTETAPDRCETKGYTLVNLHVGWHKLLDGKASLWLDINNIFDRRYYAAGGSGSRTFYDMPQQPRTWMLSLDYRF